SQDSKKGIDMARYHNGSLRGAVFVSFFLLPLFAGCSKGDPAATPAANDPGVAERTAPVGQVAVEGGDASAAEEQGAFETAPEASTVIAPAESGAAGAETTAAGAAADHPGKKTYDETCTVCHGTGAAGAPKLGDPDAWAGRIAQGIEVLYDHSINGFQGKAGIMPPKGGRADLDDDAVKAAVDYMLENSK
ncbi:MAG: c-type cytochrome, partial [Gammaproteobacteria bacterium]